VLAVAWLSSTSQRTCVLNSDGTELEHLSGSDPGKSIKEQIMDKKSASRPAAAARPSETIPEDLHVPEHEPPSMPEGADKPEMPTEDQVADLTASAPAGKSGSAAPRASNAVAGETEPEDLHVPEHEPPSMPEAADKPDKPAHERPTEPLR